ncbi:MAG TPA: neutral zinc metallopeptidase [Jatrophihabitantaceae bacterium]
MKYNEDARLDTSEVQDTRSSRLPSTRSGQAALGGGGLGVVGLLVVLLVNVLGGGGGNSVDLGSVLGGLGQSGGPATADNSQVQQECKTGADANAKVDCAAVANIDSIQAYWKSELPKLGKQYVAVPTVWFSGQVSTGCGAATSDSGPFYCPTDKRVYIDLSFYEDLQKQFGAEGGLFVNAYVLAHEYGHHVQDIKGDLSGESAQEGAQGRSVRTELQADCYAGVWARHATETGYIVGLTKADVSDALDAAAAVGDDRIQSASGGHVTPETWTHGSSAERDHWFTAGYNGGSAASCDTFSGKI